MSQERKTSWPDRTSNTGPLAIRETTELLNHMVGLLMFPPVSLDPASPLDKRVPGLIPGRDIEIFKSP